MTKFRFTPPKTRFTPTENTYTLTDLLPGATYELALVPALELDAFQRAVLDSYIDGLTGPQTAERLDSDPRTIRAAAAAICRHYGARDMAHAALAELKRLRAELRTAKETP